MLRECLHKDIEDYASFNGISITDVVQKNLAFGCYGGKDVALKCVVYGEGVKPHSELESQLRAFEAKVGPEVYDTYGFRDRIVIAMEKYPNETNLAKILDAKSFNPFESRDILQSILEALVLLQEAGICHRDLKPHNIHISTDRKKAKIIDYGLSMAFGEETENGLYSGTVGYSLTPEHALALPIKLRKNYDIFAIGSIASKLFTGSNILGYSANLMSGIINTATFEYLNKKKEDNRIFSAFEIDCVLDQFPDIKYFVYRCVTHDKYRYMDARRTLKAINSVEIDKRFLQTTPKIKPEGKVITTVVSTEDSSNRIDNQRYRKQVQMEISKFLNI